MKRRSFLTTSAAATFGFQFVPSHVLTAKGAGIAPNSKIRIAAIGCGGRGAADLDGMAGEDIVALCDVDDRNAAESYKKFPGAKRFKDFRKMFDTMSDGIDAVLVATPDHTHCVAAMAAIARGKHVYCEKPLAHTVAEVRAMRKAALEKKVITQVGNQGHSSHDIRRFCELVWAGAIGKVTEVHAGCDAFKDVYCQISKRKRLEERPAVPAELDWDQWLGPLPPRPYSPAYVPFAWRGYSAFGSGCIGDWVCHVLDPSFWALDLDMPTAITAETKGYDPKADAEFYPAGSRITFEFPAKKDRGPVKIIWHDGDFSIPQPEELTKENRKVVGTGAVVIGDQGKIMHGSHGAGGVGLIPSSRQKEFKRPDEKIPRLKNGDHHKDFLDAVREGRPSGSPFEYGGALSEIGLLGMIAIRRSGTRLEWDAKQMKFTNDSEANALVAPVYREGWKGIF
ncbi:MAG TPA: Gfo/Idh/MocA family oxidoreductase [Verrucomicrobiales bacterium]|jgi:predicted dehydrogenase|nr:Gfo/Idh/MocA family oxidoreductase [Verrucomicrobiales bacterium]